MRWRYILKTVGILAVVLGLTMLFPLAWGFFAADGSTAPLSKSVVISLAVGAALILLCRCPRSEYISQQEGVAIVAIGWAAAGLLGALPFYFSTHFHTVTDAVFESVSGFTTTGASVLIDIEAAPAGLLLWRSFIQWLGGMGIIVLSVAILPFLGVGGMQLYKAEVPSPVPDKLKPRIRETALSLWRVYVLLTLAQTVLLLFGGMSLFDSLCHTFTTLPTGGFSTKNASIAHFDSLYIDSVIIFFMFMAGINFSLHFQLFKGKPLAVWRDSECRFYVAAVLVLTAIVAVNIYGETYAHFGRALRDGAFHVVSILTTTGFATADYETWPAMSQLILLLCMFLGASAGSTGGGMKCLRIMLYFKFCYNELFALIHPRSVRRVKISGKTVPPDIMRSVIGFLGLYIGLFALSAVLLASLGVDFVTSFAAVAAAIGNIGPGFGTVGPVENYAHLPMMGKWLLAWCMLLGRLEIYTVIIFLVPEFWRK
jgi:trk system potassium uptake protein TrkH